MSWRTCFRRGRVLRFPTSLVFIFLFLFSIPSASASNDAKPLDCTELTAWLAGGVSSHRLNQLVHARNIALTIDEAVANTLSTAGADPAFIQSLRTLPTSIPETGVTVCPAALSQAGDLIRRKQYDEAERILRKLVTEDPRSAALHFAYGYLHQQQEDWDGAFDEYSDSRDLMPSSSETHSRLAYIFYRYDDGDNAIAEARTALSIDPQNAEAYRYLGLGHYANDQYAAALLASSQPQPLKPASPNAYTKRAISRLNRANAAAPAHSN